jgi:ketosteroid isomerase-like protein
MKVQKVATGAVLLAMALTSQMKAQTAHSKTEHGRPDKAYLQQIWDGWSTLNPDNVANFYASGPHTFFDIAPLKYKSWQEYDSGVRKELADYKSAKFSVNDDAEVHSVSNCVWGTATVKFAMTHNNGKVDEGDMRWTVVFENQGGKWVIVHEHVSVPMQ